MLKVLKYLFVLTFVTANVSGQTWVSRARLRHHIPYWQAMMQALVNELEAREWCNLKLQDITQNIDDNLFNMHVNGTVHYTNGFVVSIQKIDIVDIESSVTSRNISNVAVPFAMVRGKINFRHMLVGHDVHASLVTPAGEYRATGTFLHTLVQIQLDVTRNLLTKEFTSSPTILNTSFGSGVRMNYMPPSHITEALSRRFWHSTFESGRSWAVNIFAPILLDIANNNRIPFPEICFNNCT